MTAPRIGELFSGYGGLGMGVQAVIGGTVAWHSEIDPGASRILAHRYPQVPNLGDITQIDWTQVEPVDVITGGSPCQDVSAAGKRAGMRPGTRSGLWAAMCDAIQIIRPALVVWENVRGVLSAGADSAVEPCPICVGDDRDTHLRALGRVVGDLAELGYESRWCGLPASAVGAPHGRHRVFLTAHPAENPHIAAGGEWRIAAPRPAESGRPRPDTGRRNRASVTDADRHAVWEQSIPIAGRQGEALAGNAGADAASDTIDSGRRPHLNDIQEGQPNLVRSGDQTVCHGCGDPVEYHDEGGLCAGICGGNCQDPYFGRPGVWNTDDAAPPTTYSDGDGLKSVGRVEPVGRDSYGRGGAHTVWGDYEPAIRRWEHATGRAAPNPTEPRRTGNPRLSPRFVEWMMGLPDGWVCDVPGVTRNDQLKALGNGVVPQQAAAALTWLLNTQEVAA